MASRLQSARARGVRHGTATGLLLAVAAAAPAADFDLRQVLPGLSGMARREAAESARRQKEDEQRRGCDQIKAWFDAGPLGIEAGRQTGADQNRAAMLLLEDGRFSRAFGKTYAQMTPEELTTLSREVLPRCLDPRGPLGSQYAAYRGVAYTALSPQRQGTNTRQQNAVKGAAAELEALSEELRALPPTEAGYARLNGLRQAGESASRTAGAAAVAPYQQALAEAEERVAAPVLTAQTSAAVAAASGYDGLAPLARLAADLQRRAGSSTAARDNLRQVDARMNQIGNELATTERGRIDVLGNGMVGLERGVQWQSDFEQRYKPFLAQVRPLNDVQSYFAGRRTSTLAAASGEFGQTVRRAGSDDQLGAIQRRYLLASDGATVPGTQMLSAIAEQRREIEKRSVLGASLEQERREVATSAQAGGARPAATAARSRTTEPSAPPRALEPSAGEPTQEAMYELVRDRYEAEAERIRALARRCNTSRPSEATDAITCMSVALAGGVGADQPLKITRFEKLGCAPASGKPGYYCEFDYAASGGPTKFMGPITQSLMGEGNVGNARFLRRSGAWMMIYRAE